MKRSGLLGLVAAVGLILAVALAACGGSSSSSSSSTPSGGGSTTASGGSGGESEEAGVAEAKKLLAKYGKGVGGPLPSSPTTPPAGKEVWILSCSQAASGCSIGADAAKEAAEIAGLTVRLVDGEGDASKYNTAIEQARVAGADAMILFAIDCAPVKQSLQRAKEAGMIIEDDTGFDCDDPVQGGTEPLFTHQTEPEKGVESWRKAALIGGELQAAWAIANIEGKKEAIQFKSTDVENIQLFVEGFKKAFDCAECSVAETVPFHLTELGSPITQKAQTAMLKHPDVNVLESAPDPVAISTAQAIVNAGKTSSVDNTGLLGVPENIALIREKRGQSMSVAWPATWLGWASVDDVIRLLNEEKPEYSGWGQGIIDEESLPEGEDYEPPVDFQANYEKLWGVN
jgi:ribose transport system substrate-binding protein